MLEPYRGYTGPGGMLGLALVIIGVIIGGGLLLYAVKMAITKFLPPEWQDKALAVVYIAVALVLAALVFHWTGLI